MDIETLRVACIGLFIQSLIVDSIEPNKKINTSANKLAKRSKKFIGKNFKSRENQNLLADIVNTSWDKLCDISVGSEISRATLCLELYDNKYKNNLQDKIGFNDKLFQNFYNNSRDFASLRIRFSSKKLADESIKIINKEIYDKFILVSSN